MIKLPTAATFFLRFAAAFVVVVLTIHADAQTRLRSSEPDPEFSPFLGEALRAYAEGASERAVLLAQDVVRRSRDAEALRDAALVEALVLLRSDSRTDAQEGRARLAAAAEGRPDVARRGEVLLAAGMAALTLRESSLALELLDDALATFESQQRWSRMEAAVAPLARTWALHGEWPMTPPRFGVPAIDSAEQAQRVRRAQLEALQRRAAAWVQAPDAARAAGLELALLDARSADRTVAGLDALRELAADAPASPLALRAALSLAELLDERREWREAVRWYALAAEARDESGEAAARRAAELRRPEVIVDAEEAALPGRETPLLLTARGVRSIELEIRRFDVGRFLEERRGRLDPALLPIDGAVRLSRRIEPGATDPFDAFDSRTLSPPLSFVPEADAYVIVTHAVLHDGTAQTHRRVLVAGDAQMTVAVRGEQVVLAASRLADGKRLPISGEVLFWMEGVSFVPATVPITDGAALLRLPNEARLAGVRRWRAMLRSASGVALCAGVLPHADDAADPGACLLSAGPAFVRPGQTVSVSGVLLGAAVAAAQRDAASWRIELRDSENRTLVSSPAKLHAGGVISSELRVGAESAEARRLFVALRQGDRQIENAGGTLALRALSPEDGPFEVELQNPGWVPLSTPEQRVAGPGLLSARVRAVYPWGGPVAGGEMRAFIRATQVPDLDAGRLPLAALVRDVKATLDGQGAAMLGVPLSTLQGVAPPLGVNFHVSILARDGRNSVSAAGIVAGPERAHAWLLVDPPQPHAGAPLSAIVGLLDPLGRHADSPPRVEVLVDGVAAQTLDTEPTPRGYATRPWLAPPEARHIELRCEIAALAEQVPPLRAVRNLVLGECPVGGSAWIRAAVDSAGGHGAINLTWGSERIGDPLLIVLHDHGVRAVRMTTSESGEMSLPPSAGAASGSAWVELLAVRSSGLHRLAAAEVRGPAPTIELSGPAACSPGSIATVTATVRGAEGEPQSGVLLVRLIDAADVGTLPWFADRDRTDFSEGAPERTAAGALLDAGVAGRGHLAELFRSRSELPLALLEGGTLWTSVVPVRDGKAVIEAPLPSQPRRYRLLTSFADSRERDARAALTLDVQAGLGLAVDLPARLHTGDRTVAAIVLTAGTESSRGRLWVDAGAALVTEGLRGADGAPIAPDGDGAYVVDLHRGRTARLTLAIEAARAGDGLLRVRFEPESGAPASTVEAAHVVHGMEGDSNGAQRRAALTVRRNVFRMIPRIDADAAPRLIGPLDRSEWDLAELDPAERLPGGTLVLIRDTLEGAPLPAGADWVQAIPPTCLSMRRAVEGLTSIGQQRLAQVDRLQWAVTSSQARERVHEFVLLAVRPGACRIPPPDVRTAEGEPVGVMVTGGVERIIVAE
ncbi:MAG: hypothetical protein IPM64_15800 [Phycisphaerales bacterium]|nr:hypothetical protein [Phycisphaerales bacterium]